jgi:hypothetical protein
MAPSVKREAWTETSKQEVQEEESYYDEEEEAEYYDEEEEPPEKPVSQLKYDPIKDKLLNITAEDAVLDNSIKNFMPPEMPALDHSLMSIDGLLPTSVHYNVLAGARLESLFLSDDSIEELRFISPATKQPVPA